MTSADAYYARKRRRGRRDPIRAVHSTHRIGSTSSALDTDTVVSDVTRPITFSTVIEVTGASAAGIIFEFGDTTTGAKLGVSGGKFYLAAGSAGTAAEGVDDEFTFAALGSVGARIRVAVGFVPGAGKAWLYVNGKRALALTASGGDFTDGKWAADGTSGSFGAAQSADGSTQRPGATINGAPSDFSIVGPLEVAFGSVPAYFT